MNIDEFNKQMGDMFGDRHVSLKPTDRIAVHEMPVSSFIGTYAKLLGMRLSTYSYKQKEALKLILGAWWINGEHNCKIWLNDTCSQNEAKEMVNDFEKLYGRIQIPKENQEKIAIEKLSYKVAYLTAYGVLGKSKLFTKKGFLNAADQPITKELIDNIIKTAQNYGK